MSEGEIFFNLGGPPGPRSGRLQLHGPCGGKGDEVHEVALFFPSLISLYLSCSSLIIITTYH